MNKVLSMWQSMHQTREELHEEIVSENMMGIDFCSLLWECRPVVMLTRLTEELGLYDKEFSEVV